MSTTYEVKKKITGGYAVYYNCPQCSAELVSALREAGSQQLCPTCNRTYVVPGRREAIELQTKQAEAKAAKEQAQARARAEAEAAAARQALLEKERLQELEQQQQQERASERIRLYAARRATALAPSARKSSIGVQLVCFVLVLAGAINILAAVITAFTIIGLPFAVAYVIGAAICFGAAELLHYVESIYIESKITSEHAQFQSSVLDGIYEELRRAKS